MGLVRYDSGSFGGSSGGSSITPTFGGFDDFDPDPVSAPVRVTAPTRASLDFREDGRGINTRSAQAGFRSVQSDALSGASLSRTVPERMSLETSFGDVFNDGTLGFEQDETGSTLATLALVPGRVQEMPLSALNVLTGAKKGKDTLALDDLPTDWIMPGGSGAQNLGFGVRGDLDKALGILKDVPILGPGLDLLGKGLEEAGKIGPAIVNSGDLERLRALQGKPSDMLLRDADPSFWLSMATVNPLNHLARAMDMNSTVGDFRREMAKRGFQPGDLDAIARGEKATYDFGDHPSSSNPLLGMVQSVAGDPTNLIFGLGATKLLKIAASPVKFGIGLGSKMTKAGIVSKTVPDAVTSAVGISQGSVAAVTKAGVGHFILNTLAHPERIVKTYTKASIGLSAGLAATDATIDWLDNDEGLIGDIARSPLIKGAKELSSAIINDHPLSDSATWNFVAAFHFPVRDLIAPARTAVRKTLKVGEGAEGFLADKLGQGPNHAARLADFQQRIGGLEGASVLVNYIDKHIAFKKMNPRAKFEISSIDDAAQRGVVMDAELNRLVDHLRETAQISNKERFQTFQDWFGEQSGGGSVGVRQTWDPVRAVDHWTTVWLPMQAKLHAVLPARGRAVIGFERMLTKENLQDIKDALKVHVTDGVVPVKSFLDVAERYPQVFGGIGSAKLRQAFKPAKGKTKQQVGLAQYLVDDAQPLTWKYVQDELTRAQNRLPTGAELTAELAAREARAAARAPKPVKPQGGHREITPEMERDLLGIETRPSGPMEGVPYVPSEARVPSSAELAPIRNAQDAARGADVEFNAARDAEVQQGAIPDTVDWHGQRVSPSAKAELDALSADIKANFPGYTIKVPPKLAVIMSQAEREAPQIATQIMRMNGLFETLRYMGPFSGVGRALDGLFAPVPGTRMRENARQAILNGALPKGASPKQIDTIIAELIGDAEKGTRQFGPLRMGAPWEMLNPHNIDTVAQKHLSPETYAKIKSDYGGFTRLVDRSFNRFIQKQHQIGRAPEAAPGDGALARALESAYGHYQNSLVGRPARHLKAYYSIFRFALSPRYWAMNMLEPNIVGLLKYGSGSADKKAGVAMMAHDPRLSARERLVNEASLVANASDSGQPFLGRTMGGYISKNFDGLTVESAQQVLDSLPVNSREHAALVERFGPNEGTWSEQLSKMLYDFDTKGVKGAVDDTAAAIFSPEELQTLAPVLQRLYEINDRHYKALVNVFEGNHSRANVERVMNSYFLYWPLTYQLKAGKWLVDLLTERAFGRKTNFAGAYALANLEETHKDMLASNDEYAQMWADNETLFFTASMLFPMTPWDLGVSLNRNLRYAGGALGWWGAYKQSSDPIAWAEAVLTLGPNYDLQLLRRVLAEANDKPKAEKAVEPIAEPKKGSTPAKPKPYPAQFVPPTRVPTLQPALIGG